MNSFAIIKEFLTKKECEDLLKFSLIKELTPAFVGGPKMLDLKSRKSNVFFYDYSLDFPNLNKKSGPLFKVGHSSNIIYPCGRAAMNRSKCYLIMLLLFFEQYQLLL